MMPYQHWQPARWMRIGGGLALACGLAGGVMALLATAGAGRPFGWVVAVSLVCILAIVAPIFIAFHGLASRVTAEAIELHFGPGWIHRRIPLSQVRGVRTVRNSWWMGWGIRALGRGGWMWNVEGLDAVELELANGRRFRVGTDDPQGLEAAIRQAIAAGS